MAPQERQPHSPLRERLFQEPYHFQFFRAVRVLELLTPGRRPIGGTLVPSEEVVRFLVKPGLSFPPSDIVEIARDDASRPASMEVAFMGLIGTLGVLPRWYNELALDRQRHKDQSFVEFLNIFHHRLVSLFYLGWKRQRFPETYLPGGKDKLSGYLLDLIGLGTEGLLDRLGLHPENLIYYSGILSRSVPSAGTVESAVAYFAETRAEVEPFVERLLALAPEDRTQLGAANARLGEETVCGSHVWEAQSKFRLRLGPLDYAGFRRLLPSGSRLGPVFSLVRFMVGLEYEFEVRLVLKREEVPACVLGGPAGEGPRLGWDTWMKSPGFVHEEDPQVVFEEP